MSGPRLTLVFDDADKLYDFVISKWREISSEAIEKRGRFVVALSGGETPRELYRRLAAEGEKLIPWNKTHIFFVDERFVPDTDAASNYRMIREVLLDRAAVPLGNIHPIETVFTDPDSAANRYERDIASFFGVAKNVMPEFDLIMLGIGSDGHTASLFPGSPAVQEKKRLAAGVILGKEVRDRITLTLPVINNARNIIFLVTGKEKARVLIDVSQSRDPVFPASLVEPNDGRLLFLADSAAGELLRGKRGDKKEMKVVPSVLSETFDDFVLKLRQAEPLTDYVQIDVMDGIFVSTRSFPPELINDVKTTLDFEVHIMADDPAAIARKIQNPGLKKVIFHFESRGDHPALLRELSERRLGAGLAIRPETTIGEFGSLAEQVGTLLFLTVDPGKYGSPFKAETLAKIREARRVFPQKTIGVDGGVSPENLEIFFYAGVDYVCVGSRIFLGGKPEENYRFFTERLHELERQGISAA